MNLGVDICHGSMIYIIELKLNELKKELMFLFNVLRLTNNNGYIDKFHIGSVKGYNH